MAAVSPLHPQSQSHSLNSWQNQIHQRLQERDRNANIYQNLIQDYQKLARHARSLRSTPTITTNPIPTPPSPSPISTTPQSSTLPTASISTDPISSTLQIQLNQTKEELSELYKTQGRNAQRLLTLTDQLRERDERNRENEEELRGLREENLKFQRRKEEWEGKLGERGEAVQILQDELQTLSLELTLTEERNDALRKDNASLLQRWLDRVRDEVESVNERNERGWKEESNRESEKGKEKEVEGVGAKS